MTAEESFKAGFLLRCFDENLTVEQTEARIKKASLYVSMCENITSDAGQVKSALSLPSLKNVGLMSLAAAGTTGVAGGAALHELTKPKVDIKEKVKDMQLYELIAAYQQQANRIRALNKLKQ